MNIDGSDQDSNEQAMRFDSLFVGFVKQDKNFGAKFKISNDFTNNYFRFRCCII